MSYQCVRMGAGWPIPVNQTRDNDVVDKDGGSRGGEKWRDLKFLLEI